MEIWINLFLVFLLWNILAIIAVIYRDKWINGLNIFKEKKNVKQRHSTKGRRVVRKIIRNDPDLSLKGLQEQLRSLGTI